MSLTETSSDKIRILFLTRTLGIGGRERQLATLVKGLDKTCFDVTVVAFYDGGEFREQLERELGVQVLSLGKKGRWELRAFFFRLPEVMHKVHPHIVHGYGMVANELSWLMACLYRSRVVWGVRTLVAEVSTEDWIHRVLDRLRLRQVLSSRVDLIIVNSQAGSRSLASAGYSDRKTLVIPNGIDTDYFHPIEKPSSGWEAIRRSWGISLDCSAIGLIARIHPNKGHQTFLQAAALLGDSYPAARYICVGSGPNAYVRHLRAMSQELGVADRVIWAGWEQDMPLVYNALDISNTISEEREGFPNAVAEAMACGVPCVVTDVGDSAFIVGDTGTVVPTRDPESLARAWERLLSMSDGERCRLGLRARERIEENFSVPLLVQRTQEALESLMR